MRRAAIAICKWSLVAYPASFRREYGRAWTRHIDDLHRHARISTPRLVVRVATDVALTAPKMRLETLMGTTRKTVIAVAALLVLAGLALLSPAVAIPVAVVAGLVVVRARRHDRPIAGEVTHMTRGWYLWLAAGAILFGVGYTTLAVAGEDASTAVWATWVLSWLFAAIAAAVGVALGATRLARRS